MKSSSTGAALERVSAYAQAVIDGEIIAGPHVRNTCRRHFDDLKNGHKRGLYFDEKAATHVFNFFEKGLKLSEGQFEGIPFKLAPVQAFKLGSLFGWMRSDGTRRFRRAYVEEGKGNGKALRLSEPVPTPDGWTTIGDISVGDLVLDCDGNPTEVLGISETMHGHDCFKVVFDDGAEVIADADHLWVTDKRVNGLDGRRGPLKGQPLGVAPAWKHGVRTTREISETLRYKNGKYMSANHSIPLCGALDLPESSLPIDPYFLGVWLGDGDSDEPIVTCHNDDFETIQTLLDKGFTHSKPKIGGNTKRYRILLPGKRSGESGGALSRLRDLGLIKNKHIPTKYLRSSRAQRLELLQGLMDTDGFIASASGQCEYVSCRKDLADGVKELVMSLGMKCNINVGDATLYGRFISKKYRVMFFPHTDMPVFKMKRKLARQIERHSRRKLSSERRIVSCEQVKSEPVKCIRVAAENSLFLVGRNFIPTHNSPFAGGIGLYGLTADDEAGSQVFAAAATKDQANILFRDAIKMRSKSPALSKRTETSGGEGKEFNLAHHRSQSFFRPLSKEAGKTGSGLRPHFALCDEVHEHPNRDVMEMLERGFKFRQQPLLLMITNSGSDRNSVCWEEHEHAVKIAAGTNEPDDDFTYVGEILDDSTFSYVCALDKDDDPLTDPTCWIKANPLLGVILTNSYLEGVVAQAKQIPGKLNGILRLHFCVWTDSEKSWMSRDTVEAAMGEFDPEVEHLNKDVFLGCDLSGSKDMTVLAAVVQTGTKEMQREDGSVVDLPTYDAWVEAWTPKDTLAERARQDKAPYEKWVADGWLNAPPGPRIRNDYVAARVQKLDQLFNIKCIAYDKYAYDAFREEVDNLGLEIDHVPHPQGGKVRAKPSEDKVAAAKAAGQKAPLGLWMPGSVSALEDMIIDGRIRMRLSPVLMTALMGAAFDHDPQDNRWFVKQKASVRIDAAVALAMAIGAAVDSADTNTDSIYKTRPSFVEI